MERNRIKILSLHWGFSLGGVGKYALLINEVSKIAPITIVSVCILNKNWPSDLFGLKWLDARSIYIRSRFDLSWVPNVINTIRRENPDLIMSHGFNGHFVALLTKLLSGHKIHLVCSYHGLYHATTRGRRAFEKSINLFTEHFIRRWTLSTVAVVYFAKDYLVGKKVARDQIHVIHNGIEDERPTAGAREKLRREWNIGPEDVVIAAASRLDPVKGLEYAISAVSELAQTVPGIRFVIIGTGRSEERLKAHVEELGLHNNVIFTGFRADIIDCLAAFDIFVLPSLAEYHSIALLEAMCAGKAIIATDVGGNTESVRDGKEGLIVPPADAHALYDALERLVTDEKLRITLGDNARCRFVTHFTVDVMVQKTAEWFQRCAAMR
jgi:glycosyltransferase involved in cell wall biosynthesis